MSADTEEENSKDERYDYDELLDRATEDLPEEISHHERFQVPEVDILIEGNRTIFKNFTEITDKINRDPQKVLKYLLGELGTAGEKENGRVVFKGEISPGKITDKLKAYVEKYVLCSECGRPDTRLEKEGRVTVLRCDACGAHHPIRGKKKKSKASTSSKEIREGKTYELMIQDIGKEGDGKAKRGKYTIYVPGTTKGDKVKVRINKVKGTLAFGKPVG